MITIYETQKIRDNFYLIYENYAKDSNLVIGLIIGEKKAALIDSGMGVFGTQLWEIVRSYTDKPVINILTHGHPDHIAGSVLFEDVYMNCRDENHIGRITKEKRLGDTKMFSRNDPEVLAYAQEHCLDCSGFQYQNIDAGDQIDLGGTILDIYKLPGHSLGSIAIVNKKDHYAMVGDAFSERVAASAMPNLAAFREMADAIAFFIKALPENTTLYGGHWRDPISMDLISEELQCASELAQGRTESDEDVFLPIAPIPHQKKHIVGRVGISYNPAILNQTEDKA